MVLFYQHEYKFPSARLQNEEWVNADTRAYVKDLV